MIDTRKIKPSCVYCILNIHTDDRYVGSTSNFSDRKGQHLYDLRHNKARSRNLQTAFNQYGEASFKFFILEEVLTFDRQELIEREQYWIDQYKPIYNLNPIAGNHFNSSAFSEEAKRKRIEKLVGRKQSPEHVKSRMDTMKRNGKQKLKRLTEEQKSHLSKINMGQNNPNWGTQRSQETRDKASNSMSKIIYFFLNPKGEEVTIQNLSKFVRENRMWGLNKLRYGKIKIYKGWIFLRAEKAK